MGSRPSIALLATAAVLFAGCGSSRPQLAREDAAPLIALADRIPHETACAQARDIRALRARAIALANARRIPVALQETLTSGVNALVAPACLPTITTPTITTVPKHGHGHGHGHGDGGGGD